MEIRKVLLLGDYSAVHLTLRNGLRKLGVDCVLASEGDGYKGFETDINLSGKGQASRVEKLKHQAQILARLKGFDVVQTVSPSLGFGVLKSLAYIHYLKAFNQKVFSLICAPDYHIWRRYREEFFRYSPYWGMEQDHFKRGEKVVYDQQPFTTRTSYKLVVNAIDGLISLSSEYHQPYEGHKKHVGMIPFPVDTESICYADNEVDGPVKILHGVQRGREHTKGSPFVLAALEKIKSQYGSRVEILEATSVPYAQWQQLQAQAHILIDQTNCFAPGMNALQAMAMGKIVLTGAEKEFLDYHGYKTQELPFFNAEPSEEQIVQVLDNLLQRQHEFVSLGRAARKYVEEHHHYLLIAKRYVKLWNSR